MHKAIKIFLCLDFPQLSNKFPLQQFPIIEQCPSLGSWPHPRDTHSKQTHPKICAQTSSWSHPTRVHLICHLARLISSLPLSLPPPNPPPLAHLIAAFLNQWDFIASPGAALDLCHSNGSGPAGSSALCSPLRSIPNGWEGSLRLNTIWGWKVLHYTLTVCFVSCSPFAVF